jgi:hypothetical protein
MTLYGKGYYMWQLPHCDGGIPENIAWRVKNAGLSHVLIKIADGPNWKYNYDYQTKTDLIPPVANALREIGVQVWGWHYIRGDDPLGEARIAVNRMTELALDGYTMDPEWEYKAPGKDAAARAYLEELRSGLKNTPVALSTYRFPKWHPEFPFVDFLRGCDINMPQVYFEGAHNPEHQIDLCIQQYMEIQPALPIIPTVSTYASDTWRPTPDEITRFLQHAKNLGLTAVNAWSYDFATNRYYIDLFSAVADFPWPPAPPVADIPEQVIGKLNQHDASRLSELYQENAAHVTGARTVVGRTAVQQWYQILLTDLLPQGQFQLTGKSGLGSSRHYTWTAQSQKGEVLDGKDTIGIRDGLIQYHYTYFTVR